MPCSVAARAARASRAVVSTRRNSSPGWTARGAPRSKKAPPTGAPSVARALVGAKRADAAQGAPRASAADAGAGAGAGAGASDSRLARLGLRLRLARGMSVVRRCVRARCSATTRHGLVKEHMPK